MTQRTYTALFTPTQIVYHASLESGIRKGVVQTVQVVDNDIAVINYFVLFDGTQTPVAVQSNLYEALGSAKVGTAGGGALEGYELLLTTP